MRRISTFLKDDRGAETVQFVMFVPLFAFALVIATDAGFLYLTHSEMWNVARDTARRMAAGQLTSAQEAEDFAAGQLTMYENPYQIKARYDRDTSMTIGIAVNIADAMVFGAFLAPLLDDAMVARVVMRSEPEDSG